MTGTAEPSRGNGTRFVTVDVVDTTESTNADLLEAARNGQSEPVVRVTDHQTRGRGRQARTWVDRPGTSLLVSWAVDIDPTHGRLLPFLTGLAALDAIAEVGVEPDAVGLKWPNDVLVAAGFAGVAGFPGFDGEAKMAGILVESVAVGSRFRAVIGMGMNLVADPAHPDRASLDRLVGRFVERDVVLEAYLRAVDHRLSRLEADPSSVLVEYRRRCLTLGRTVAFEVTGAGQVVEGRAVEVDDDGRLVIVDRDGMETALMAGDAHHRRAVSD